MPRKRNKENRGLPDRWRFTRNAYYYQVPPGREADWSGKQTFKLGKTLPEAYAEWARRIADRGKIATIGQLLDRYTQEVIPTKALRTQNGNITAVKRVRAVFGDLLLGDIKPKDIYKYHDDRTSKTDARQEIALLRHAYTKAIQWGLIDPPHPFKWEVRIENPPPRTRYVTDDEIVLALSLPRTREGDHTPMVQAYISLKLLTGMRQRDLLLLRENNISDDGIRVMPSKTTNSTGKEVIYEWTEELRAAVEFARVSRSVDISPYLFCDRTGKCFVDPATGRADVWARLWQRFMARLLKSGLKERFTEHDLRAKASSDAESDERARQLLTHANVQITRRVYRRKPERVKPLR